MNWASNYTSLLRSHVSDLRFSWLSGVQIGFQGRPSQRNSNRQLPLQPPNNLHVNLSGHVYSWSCWVTCNLWSSLIWNTGLYVAQEYVNVGYTSLLECYRLTLWMMPASWRCWVKKKQDFISLLIIITVTYNAVFKKVWSHCPGQVNFHSGQLRLVQGKQNRRVHLFQGQDEIQVFSKPCTAWIYENSVKENLTLLKHFCRW